LRGRGEKPFVQKNVGRGNGRTDNWPAIQGAVESQKDKF